MANFDNYIKIKKIKLKDNTGLEQEYTFKALTAKQLPKLFDVLNAFSGINEKSKPEEILEKMNEKNVDNCVFLIKEMVKSSYPSINEEQLEYFVSANFVELFPLLIELNMNKE